MQQVIFSVPGKPQGKARAKTYHNHGVTRTVTPEKTVLYENFIKECFLRESNGVFFDKGTPVYLIVEIRYAPPKSTSKKRYTGMMEGKEYPTKKPDADNVLKVICDALNGVAYYDDAQIIYIACGKKYAVNDGLTISLYGMEAGGKNER